MIIKKELIKRTIAGDTVLVPVGKTVLEANGLFVLSEVAAFIWDLLPQAEDEEAIVAAVLAEYEVSQEVARQDVADFLAQLKKMQIL